MKLIKLTKGQVAVVDDEDYDRLIQYSWHAIQKRKGGKFYAERSFRLNGKRKNVRMHHEVMRTNYMIDHINGDGLDNRKNNLRFCNNSQNHQNIPKMKGKYTSKYKGVTKRGNKWEANIRAQQKQIYLGSFDKEIDAAKAYNKAAKRFFKAFSRLNIIRAGTGD